MWLERPLMFSELRKEDFDVNYTCRVYSARGRPLAYFTLLPSGKPNNHVATYFKPFNLSSSGRLKQSEYLK